MTRIILQTIYGSASIMVDRDDLSATEVLEDLVRPVMLASGYDPQTVDSVFPDCDDCPDLGKRETDP